MVYLPYSEPTTWHNEWYTRYNMAHKQKKKRNKQYRGVDASLNRPVVTKVSAVNRSKLGQWWFDRKKILKPILIAAGVIAVIVWLIFELVRITTN